MRKSKKRKRLTLLLSIIVIFLIACIVFGLFLYKRILIENQKAEEQAIIDETNRINNLAILDTYYLALDEELIVNNISDYDSSIISVTKTNDNKNILKAINPGTTTFYDIDSDVKYMVSVSDLYEKAHIDNEKESLPCHQYTDEQAAYLDTVLQDQIIKAGYKSRAGALQAARFLVLQFPYRILYFCENGRLDTSTGHPYNDAEGRFYHKGLYLSNNKFDEIVYSEYGPAIWGCDLYEMPENRMYYNGIDCSGFITWALYNAGYDPGDIGGGYGIESEGFDCVDLGEAIYINEIDMSKVKAGDLIGYSGHIGMILGIDNTNVYVGQAYWTNDLECLTYTFEELKESVWDYIILMDQYYENQGNYTNLW